MDFDSFVLAASTGDLDEEPRARDHAEAVEFRMDLASDPLAAIEDYDGELPLIATNRPTWEGGDREDGQAREDELLEAVKHDPVDAVDVELRALTEVEEAAVDLTRVVQTAPSLDVSVMVSLHDFEDTPELSALAELAAQVCAVGDVGKLAVTATEKGQVLDLLRVTHEFASADRRIATMAMGEAGAHSRVVAPLYGSRIGYAPVDPESATAPGQFDLATIRRLIDELSTSG
jgi:3-dehydroquinate dehydratase-1